MFELTSRDISFESKTSCELRTLFILAKYELILLTEKMKTLRYSDKVRLNDDKKAGFVKSGSDSAAISSTQLQNITGKLLKSLRELSDLENSSKLREDAIRNGKAIIANWRPPSDNEIDKIFLKMKSDLLDAV